MTLPRFPKQKRRMELYTKPNLTPEEKVELDLLHAELEEFRKVNKDWDPSVPLTKSLAEELKKAGFHTANCTCFKCDQDWP